MIKIKKLEKSFKKLPVLKGINLNIEEPGILAILGPNGSGKTTLLKCILGMVIPDSGSILFNDQNIKGQFQYRHDIGYLSQVAKFPENLTGRELIKLIKSMKHKNSREDELVKLFNIQNELDKKMGTLSGGNQQKINIVLALMHDDPFIILDEPSNGLDPLSLKNFKEFLRNEKKRGKTIVITTHIMTLAEELADQIVFIKDGIVFYNGSLDELLILQLEDTLENAIAKILVDKKKQLKNEAYSKIQLL